MKASSILERSSTIYSDEYLFWCGNESVTYKKAFHLYEQYKLWIWRGIQSAIQKIEGQHVEIVVTFLSRNTPELLLFILACIDISGSYENGGFHIYTAMLNIRWSATEMAQALKINAEDYINQSGMNNIAQRPGTHHVTLILCEDNFLKVARDTRTLILSDSIQHETTVEVLPTMFQMESRKRTFEVMTRNHTEISSRDQLNREAIILFTSGTTSGPKGVRLSHLSLILQAMAKTSSPCGYNVESRIMGNCVPFFHVGGLSSALAVMAIGGALVFPANNGKESSVGFDPKQLLQSMRQIDGDGCESNEKGIEERKDINTLVVVPAMIHSLWYEYQSLQKQKISYPYVQLLLVGGQNLTIPQLRYSKTMFPRARIVQTYACTEAGSSITFATVHDPDVNTIPRNKITRKGVPNGSFAGMPPVHIQIKIFPMVDGKAIITNAPHYQVGLIGTRGPHTMNGYWNRGGQECNLQSDTNYKGWLITNDLGYLDEKGGLYFCGRSNDVIRTGGESVFAPEVENTLVQHPQVDKCAAFALEDEKFGESVCAAIVSVAGKIKSSFESMQWRDELRSFCAQKDLAGYKRPRRVFILKDLPQNSSGKVLKNELKIVCEGLKSIPKSRL